MLRHLSNEELTKSNSRFEHYLISSCYILFMWVTSGGPCSSSLKAQVRTKWINPMMAFHWNVFFFSLVR